MEKSPVESLKEWQELVTYVSENTKQTLVVPENNIAVKLEWERDVIFRKILLLAQYNLNGVIRSRKSEISLVGSGGSDEDTQLIAEGMRQLSEEVARDVTDEIYSRMMVKLLESRPGGMSFP